MTDTIERMIDHSQSLSINTRAVNETCQMVSRLRGAQTAWQERAYRDRLKLIGRLAGTIADHGDALAQSVFRPAATLGEIMASEIMPLAEACRYAANRGSEILKPRRLRQRDGVWWMGSIEVTELREALGVVLIIGPSNYPLFLPGVQLIQALAAGNAVIVKPAPGCEDAMRVLIELCIETGVPADVLLLLDTAPRAAEEVIEAGVDKVLFTGSLTTGRKVSQLCSQHMTPASMELSGNDAVIVNDDADLVRVATCISYALSLNGGQTCIAPRRLFATMETLERLIPLLNEQLAQAPARSIAPRGLDSARELIESAIGDGAAVACGELSHFAEAHQVKPIVLKNVQSEMTVAQEDIFAPLLSLIAVIDMQDAVRQASNCRFALGAAVFGQTPDIINIVTGLTAGCVTVNDVLVPTADPRVSFGGRHASGYGLTRGLEGLRELTQLKVICARRGRWLPHLTTSDAQLGPMMQGILKLRHGRNLRQRWAGIKNLMKAGKGK